MPVYASQTFIISLGPGEPSVVAWNAEQPAPGAAPNAPSTSIAVAVAHKGGHEDQNISLEIQFSGAPGVFEVDLLEADTNTINAFQIANGGNAKISAVNSQNWARLDVTNFRGNFAAVCVAARANAVNLTAKLSR